jgi:hypothetical protein
MTKYLKELLGRDTIAIGITNIKGLTDKIFEGASATVRRYAGMPNLNDIAPNRPIKSPRNLPLFTRHAEEDLANQFVYAVERAGLTPDEVVGILHILQSNSGGVFWPCLQGIKNPDVPEGIILQLSRKYPDLLIQASSSEGSKKVNGLLYFQIKNGKFQ